MGEHGEHHGEHRGEHRGEHGGEHGDGQDPREHGHDGDPHPLDGDVEAAWLALRVALADELTVLEPGQEWAVNPEGPTEDEVSPRGITVLVEGEALRALTGAGHEGSLTELGWLLSLGPEPAGWSLEVPTAEADRLALVVVRTLREVHGCLHPAFCEHDPIVGYDPSSADPSTPDPSTHGPDGPDDDDPAPRDGTGRPAALPTFPRDRDELVEAVDAALADLLAEVADKDDDGDVPVRCGRSVVFVRVDDDKPLVEFYAEVLHGVTEPERLPVEVDALNRRHRFARFHTRDDVVVMRSELCAWPFAPTQLAVVLSELCDTVEDVRRDLVARVGGHAFLEPEPDPRAAGPIAPGVPRGALGGAAGLDDELDSPLVVLTELLHEGPVPVRCVAEAFDRDRSAIIHTIVLVRRGLLDLDGHDPDTVLRLLRLALRLVVDGRAEIAAAPRPPRRLSEQTSLLDDADLGGGVLDLDWPV